MNPHVVQDPQDEHRDAEEDERQTEVVQRLSALQDLGSCSLWNTWAIVNPKPISDSDVRMTDISVRSALIRVR